MGTPVMRTELAALLATASFAFLAAIVIGIVP